MVRVNPTDPTNRIPVKNSHEEIAETWTEPNLKIIADSGEIVPTIAVVRGRIGFLSYNFVYLNRAHSTFFVAAFGGAVSSA